MIYVIADTHFGHKMLVENNLRQAGFEQDIITKWNRVVRPVDTVIHCGDWSLGRYKGYSLSHSVIMWHNQLSGNIILIRGNHDRNKPCSWYMKSGFAACADRMEMEINGTKLTFTHEPVKVNEGFNIHGHIHSRLREMEAELSWYKTGTLQHFNVGVDHTNNRPIQINTLIGQLLKREKG